MINPKNEGESKIFTNILDDRFLSLKFKLKLLISNVKVSFWNDIFDTLMNLKYRFSKQPSINKGLASA